MKLWRRRGRARGGRGGGGGIRHHLVKWVIIHSEWERKERERERERNGKRRTQRDRHTKRDRESERGRERETERHTDMSHTLTDTHRHTHLVCRRDTSEIADKGRCAKATFSFSSTSAVNVSGIIKARSK